MRWTGDDLGAGTRAAAQEGEGHGECEHQRQACAAQGAFSADAIALGRHSSVGATNARYAGPEVGGHGVSTRPIASRSAARATLRDSAKIS